MNLKNKNVLVTGAAGFIPSHIVDMAVEEGAHVTAIDNLKDGFLKNLDQSKEEISFKRIDVRDFDKVKEIMQDQDVVFHLAGNANVPYSVKNPHYDFQANTLGSFNVFKACIDSDVKKVLYASTAAVYGNPINPPIDESHPLHPISPYGATKLSAERLGFAYHESFGLPFTAFRIFNTYGPRVRRYVMFDLLTKLNKNPKKLEVLGTGEQIRDYSYISDTVKAFMLAAKSKLSIGEVFNISGGKATSIKELVSLIIELQNLKTEIYYTGQSWKGDIKVLLADNTKIINKLGFKKEVELKEGLRRMIEWFKNEYR